MLKRKITSRQRLLLSACAVACTLTPAVQSAAQQAQVNTGGIRLAQLDNAGIPSGTPQSPATTNNNAITPDVSKGAPEQITVRAARRLLKEKDAPSAVTELGEKAISQVGISGSVATVLRQAPSVYVYQQGLGNSEPVLTIRGTRGLEVASTLDDVPTQDLLNGGSGSFLQNIIGAKFNLDQISGVTIYPGVAFPDKNTFGTIGGTVAYSTKRPTNDEYIDVFGSVGSFGTFNEGFTYNSGRLEGLFGTGDNAPKLLLQYSNQQNKGYVDYTPQRFNNLDFSFDKPYNDGLSKFQLTALYNTGNGLFTPEPVPTPYQNQNGAFANYPTSALFNRENNDYATLILKDDTYINDYLGVGLSVFYEATDSSLLSYGNSAIFSPGGETNPFIIGGANPFVQVPAGFGQQGDYGPGGAFYDPQAYRYNGSALFPPNSKNCPASTSAQFAAAGLPSPCGYNAELILTHNDTYGIQPRIVFTPPEIFGINNTIQAGALIAKETSPASPAYLWGTPNVPQTPGNLVAGYDGGVQRTIYQGYIQDKIELLDNTLHLTPGGTLQETNSSDRGSKIFGGVVSASDLATPYCKNQAVLASQSLGIPCLTGAYEATKFDRVWLPFFNVSYDLDKILPAAKGVSLYGSTGQSALYAPVTDFSPNLIGAPPNATIVHLYEGGVKYNVSNFSGNIDYFYQKVDRDFGFFQFQSGPDVGLSLYNNGGQREFKGFEASGTYQLTPQWQLFGNVSHLLAKYLKTTVDNVTVQEDQFGVVGRSNPVSGIPDWLSTFGVEYTKKNLFRDADVVDVRFQGQYTGKQQTTYDLNGFTNIGTIPGVAPFGPRNQFSSYNYYNVTAGATTYDPNGGISPFAIFNLDLNYVLPTPALPVLKQVKFDLNIANLFDQRYFQYFYKQVAPSSCPAFTDGTFGSSPVKSAHPTNTSGQGPLAQSSYTCTPQFADSIPGQPFTIVFTVSARF